MVSLSCQPFHGPPFLDPTNRVNLRHQILLSGTSAASETLQASEWLICSPSYISCLCSCFFAPFSQGELACRICVLHFGICSCVTTIYKLPHLPTTRYRLAVLAIRKTKRPKLKEFPPSILDSRRKLFIDIFLPG